MKDTTCTQSEPESVFVSGIAELEIVSSDGIPEQGMAGEVREGREGHSESTFGKE